MLVVHNYRIFSFKLFMSKTKIKDNNCYIIDTIVKIHCTNILKINCLQPNQTLNISLYLMIYKDKQ